MRDILANASNHQTWGTDLAYAAGLAARLGASLTGVYVYPSPMTLVPPYASGGLLETILENARETERNALAAAEPFVTWAQARGVAHAAWQIAEGNLPLTLAHMGNWHDLLVLGRDVDAPWGTPADVGAVVLASGLPCLVVPEGVTEVKLDTVALAWNGAIEGMRAIHAALPLLVLAKRVVLLAGIERERFVEKGWKPPFEIETYLSAHGITAERREISASDDNAGEALLSACKSVNADLLVMGAYGRSRFSEWVYGGATRDILAGTKIPLFLRK